jgi:hypothetical protein
MTADDFWVMLDDRRSRPRKPRLLPKTPPVDPSRETALSPDESAYWLEQFRDIEQDAQAREALGTDIPMLTDEEIAELEREIDREMGGR